MRPVDGSSGNHDAHARDGPEQARTRNIHCGDLGGFPNTMPDFVDEATAIVTQSTSEVALIGKHELQLKLPATPQRRHGAPRVRT